MEHDSPVFQFLFQNTTQAARFPKPDGSVRKVEDKTSFCRKWKRNGGCDLDKDHFFSERDPLNGRIRSFDMFEFMQSSCMDSCGWAENKVRSSRIKMIYFFLPLPRIPSIGQKIKCPSHGLFLGLEHIMSWSSKQTLGHFSVFIAQLKVRASKN